MAAEPGQGSWRAGNADESERNDLRPASTEGAGRALPQMLIDDGGDGSRHREWLCVHLVRMQRDGLRGTVVSQTAGRGRIDLTVSCFRAPTLGACTARRRSRL